jgi:hypothetical protein
MRPPFSFTADGARPRRRETREGATTPPPLTHGKATGAAEAQASANYEVQMNDVSRHAAGQARAATTPARRRTPFPLLLRKLHGYVGMLIAPSVIFFAATGILQVYHLHEAHGAYAPAPIVQKLGTLHKDQTLQARRRGGPPAAAGARRARPPEAAEAGRAGPNVAVQLLKAFFALAAAGLIFSTAAGVWIALQQPLRRRAHLWLLAAGAIVPTVLALLSA